jgi:hypothetical protein
MNDLSKKLCLSVCLVLAGCGVGEGDEEAAAAPDDEVAENASALNVDHYIGSWNLYPDTVTVAGNWDPPSFSTFRFRWVTDNPHSTYVSVNRCSDGLLYNRITIAAHDTGWHYLGGVFANCVSVRGRSAYGTQLGRKAYVREVRP